ncbi:MAG TPA: hypothetical protein P5248_04085 [Bacteroidales bacterium]|nr:hypothetical protein [Bacteroidales bacterium]
MRRCVDKPGQRRTGRLETEGPDDVFPGYPGQDSPVGGELEGVVQVHEAVLQYLMIGYERDEGQNNVPCSFSFLPEYSSCLSPFSHVDFILRRSLYEYSFFSYVHCRKLAKALRSVKVLCSRDQFIRNN